LAKQVAEGDRAYYALEVSSFQLDGCYSFRPYIGILTNITPDHLDRYEYKLENYIASKFRIAANKEPDDIFIYNAEDENLAYGFQHFWKQKDKTGGIAVSMKALAGDAEFLEVEHCGYKIRRSELTIQGWHNRFNISCAVLAAKQLGISDAQITAALKSFVNEAHRLESVITINEVEYINDSKATNVDSVFYALEAMTKPVVWIVGGVDKGNDYSPLFDLVREKVRAIVCMGKDNSKIITAFSNMKAPIVETGSMQEALKSASLYAESGDVVLLSPACASFDLFNNYQHRGDTFKEILKHSTSSAL
jgi:UDP-N-acetylmuramoylalanine--D-glutamate ligase